MWNMDKIECRVWARRSNSNWAESVCVCVSLRALHLGIVFSNRGTHGIHDLPCATKLRSRMGREGWSPSCTCFQHTDSTGSPCCCFLISWLFSCYLPHKQVSTARELSLSHCRCASTLVQQYFSADPCTFPFPHLPSRLGNWANWKPMSECEPLSRPTWVLGVILRKEAPFSFRNSCNWIFVSTIRWIFLTDSFSPLD